jgi:hypothetical protein
MQNDVDSALEGTHKYHATRRRERAIRMLSPLQFGESFAGRLLIFGKRSGIPAREGHGLSPDKPGTRLADTGNWRRLGELVDGMRAGKT